MKTVQIPNVLLQTEQNCAYTLMVSICIFLPLTAYIITRLVVEARFLEDDYDSGSCHSRHVVYIVYHQV